MYIFLLEGFFFSCLKKKAIVEEIVEQQNYPLLHQGLSSDSMELRMLSMQGLWTIVSMEQKREIFLQGMKDSERYIREEVVDLAWQEQKIAWLKQGWDTATLSDGEKCLLALKIFSLSEERSQGLWPIISQSTSEDKALCSIAAHQIVGLSSTWENLIRSGDYPFSLLFIQSMIHFLDPEDLRLFDTELEWAEESMYPSLLAAWLLIDPSKQGEYKEEILGLEEVACLEMVDVAWDSLKTEASIPLLKKINNRSDFCGRWADLALSAKGEKRPVDIHRVFEKGSREEILGSLRAIAEYPFEKSSEKEKQRILADIEKLLVYDEDPMILAALIDAIAVIGDKGSSKRLMKLSKENIEPFLQMKIEIGRSKIAERSRR